MIKEIAKALKQLYEELAVKILDYINKALKTLSASSNKMGTYRIVYFLKEQSENFITLMVVDSKDNIYSKVSFNKRYYQFFSMQEAVILASENCKSVAEAVLFIEKIMNKYELKKEI